MISGPRVPVSSAHLAALPRNGVAGGITFGCIDAQGYEVEIDRIVVLIGPNNVGKSTLLDAY